MNYQCAMLVTKDMAAARAFYEGLLGQKAVMDLGANVAYQGGFALQTLESWTEFISTPAQDIRFKGRDFELYFETEDLEAFLERLEGAAEPVCPPVEHPWGQKVARIYDPDGHIVEVGESMEVVIRRFLQGGMSVEETSKRTMYPVEFVEQVQKNLGR